MLLSSTSTLENKTIIKYHGLVNGESLIGSNIYKDLFSGVRDVVEGRTSTYAEENNLGGTMGNTILVTVYGTAVSYK